MNSTESALFGETMDRLSALGERLDEIRSLQVEAMQDIGDPPAPAPRGRKESLIDDHRNELVMSFDLLSARALPFAQTLGVECVSAELNEIGARLIVRPDLCTLGGICHGGATSFTDTGGAASSPESAEGAKSTTTLDARPISSPARQSGPA